MLALFKYACDPNGAGRGIYFSPDCNATVTQQYAYNNPVDEDTPLWKQSNGDFWWNDELTKPLRRAPLPPPLCPPLCPRLCPPLQ